MKEYQEQPEEELEKQEHIIVSSSWVEEQTLENYPGTKDERTYWGDGGDCYCCINVYENKSIHIQYRFVSSIKE